MPPDGPAARPLRSWRQVVAFSAGLVAGLIGSLIESIRTRHRPRPLLSWPHRLFGYTKREVARLLGPPPAAAMGQVDTTLPALPLPLPPPPPPPPTFWQADTWYYPVDRRRRNAVAVQFDADRVVRVEVLGEVA
jgi:hypothetical protein